MAQPVLGEPALTDVYQIHIKGQLNDETIRMVLHYRLTSIGAETLDNRWDLYEGLFNMLDGVGGVLPKLRASVSEDFDFDWVRIQRVGIVRQVYRQFPYLFSGGVESAACPPNVALALNKRTGTIGRHGHGTLHLCGVPLVHLDGGLWNLGAMTQVAAFAAVIDDTIITPVDGYGLEPCLAPEFDSIAPPALITEVNMSPEVRTMYRRTKGIGE